MKAPNKTPLYFVQWAILDDHYHAQYETFDFLKVIKKIESVHGMKVESVEHLGPDTWLILCDYGAFNVSINGMEKLIDCEAI